MKMGGGPKWPLPSEGDMSEQLKEAQEQLAEAEGADDRDEALIAVLADKVSYLADAEEADSAAKVESKASRSSAKE